MSAEQPSEKQPLEIVSDDDWKSRVKAEDAARDAERNIPDDPETVAPAAEPGGESQRPKIDASQLPPASFPLVVSMFSTQAMTALGLLPNPITGKVELEPALAKHYIDVLSVLETKTQGNLDSQETQMLSATLHELRMIYVEQARTNS